MRTASPGRLNVKIRPPLNLYFGVQLVFSGLFFFALFAGDVRFCYRRAHPDFLSFVNFFLSIG